MHFLTPQEQRVIIVALILLVTGLAVKTWRETGPNAVKNISVAEE